MMREYVNDKDTAAYNYHHKSIRICFTIWEIVTPLFFKSAVTATEVRLRDLGDYKKLQ